MAYTIKIVADLAGLTVRALHHYDHIGLLRPSRQSEAGYRLYTEADLERLQQVLFFREIGFNLQDIKAILDSPSFDRKQALVEHRQTLREKQRRLAKLITSVPTGWTLRAKGMGLKGKGSCLSGSPLTMARRGKTTESQRTRRVSKTNPVSSALFILFLRRAATVPVPRRTSLPQVRRLKAGYQANSPLTRGS